MLHSENFSKSSLSNLINLCKRIDYPLSIRFTKYIDIKKNNHIFELNEREFNSFFSAFSKSTSDNINVRISKLVGENMGIACGQMRASLLEKGNLTIWK